MWGIYAMVMSLLFVCFIRSFVRLSVACEICKVIRYVAAPGGGLSRRVRCYFCRPD